MCGDQRTGGARTGVGGRKGRLSRTPRSGALACECRGRSSRADAGRTTATSGGGVSFSCGRSRFLLNRKLVGGRSCTEKRSYARASTGIHANTRMSKQIEAVWSATPWLDVNVRRSRAASLCSSRPPPGMWLRGAVQPMSGSATDRTFTADSTMESRRTPQTGKRWRRGSWLATSSPKIRFVAIADESLFSTSGVFSLP